MTLHSMTGFGAARAERTLPDGSTLSIVVEIKTVNHRHLQTKVRLPIGFSSMESPVERAVRARLSRGAAQVSVELTRSGGGAAVRVDEQAVARYLAIQDSLLDQAEGLGRIASVSELLGLPGVIVQERSSHGGPRPDEEQGAVLAVVEEALDALVAMRAVEGEAMGVDVARSGEQIAGLVARVGERMSGAAERHRTRLLDRVRELAGDTSISETDLAREVALLAERLDISEELTRLESHLDQLRSVLEGGGAVGRQLDFLAQEFFREANTVGSKCNDADVAHLVVDLKTHVERLREQVQNIE